MKILSNEPPHDCQALAVRFQNECEADGGFVYLGAVVECDCGSQLTLADHQFDGPYWKYVSQGALG